jgi:hypothetical protein
VDHRRRKRGSRRQICEEVIGQVHGLINRRERKERKENHSSARYVFFAVE